MTGNVKRWLAAAALAVATAASLTAWAQGPGGGAEHDPARMLAHISDRLDLSTEQQGKVATVLASSRQASAADHKRMQELRTQMQALRENFDPAQARKIADEIGQVTGRLVYQASATWSEVYQLLNAEQKATLDGLMADRESRRAKWRDKAKPAPAQ